MTGVPSGVPQQPGWHLLAEFSPRARSGSGYQLADWCTGVLRQLGLQPPQMERVRGVLIEALDQATREADQGSQGTALTTRIWVSQACISKPPRFGPKLQGSDDPASRGWGFFLIHKWAYDGLAAENNSRLVIELFLYQEGQSAPAV